MRLACVHAPLWPHPQYHSHKCEHTHPTNYSLLVHQPQVPVASAPPAGNQVRAFKRAHTPLHTHAVCGCLPAQEHEPQRNQLQRVVPCAGCKHARTPACLRMRTLALPRTTHPSVPVLCCLTHLHVNACAPRACVHALCARACLYAALAHAYARPHHVVLHACMPVAHATSTSGNVRTACVRVCPPCCARLHARGRMRAPPYLLASTTLGNASTTHLHIDSHLTSLHQPPWAMHAPHTPHTALPCPPVRRIPCIPAKQPPCPRARGRQWAVVAHQEEQQQEQQQQQHQQQPPPQPPSMTSRPRCWASSTATCPPRRTAATLPTPARPCTQRQTSCTGSPASPYTLRTPRLPRRQQLWRTSQLGLC